MTGLFRRTSNQLDLGLRTLHGAIAAVMPVFVLLGASGNAHAETLFVLDSMATLHVIDSSAPTSDLRTLKIVIKGPLPNVDFEAISTIVQRPATGDFYAITIGYDVDDPPGFPDTETLGNVQLQLR